MIPPLPSRISNLIGIPRESGDDPSKVFNNVHTIMYSPRERG